MIRQMPIRRVSGIRIFRMCNLLHTLVFYEKGVDSSRGWFGHFRV